MTVTLVPATADHHQWIRDELQSYLTELSQFTTLNKNSEGQFEYPYLEHYWRVPDRHPFVIQLGNEAAGFLLARHDRDPEDGTSLTEIAELYVLPVFRGRGVAGDAINRVVGFYPGKWRAAVLSKNLAAHGFWKKTVSKLDPAFTETAPIPRTNPNFVFTFRCG